MDPAVVERVWQRVNNITEGSQRDRRAMDGEALPISPLEWRPSLLAYWFHLRFEVEPASLGAIFFGANLLAGFSALAAVVEMGCVQNGVAVEGLERRSYGRHARVRGEAAVHVVNHDSLGLELWNRFGRHVANGSDGVSNAASLP